MTDRRSVTSYDVARAAGVSQSAVSRAFSPSASIAEKTRRHVLDIARDLGYQPNAIARSMSSARTSTQQRSGMVGVIVTRLEDPFFSEIIAQFSRDLQARGWHMLLFTVDSAIEVDEALNALMQFKIDGVVILSALLSGHMAGICREQGIPVMLYNRNTEGLDISSVQIDNHEGGRIAAEILCEAGCERIAYVGGEAGDATAADRGAGMIERLAEAGIIPFAMETGDYTFQGGREAGLRLLARSHRPDAVFCASDVMALGVLHAARYELDLQVPRDFSLIGFDDAPAASWPGHMLTTIRQPFQAMVREAVNILVERMENPEVAPDIRRFSGRLILRDTVRRG